ncbi:MAG: hypothetical protein AAGH76_17420 [Pseudomonadota bacterium]
MKLRQIAWLLVLLIPYAAAQDGQLEEIVVTGSRISASSYDMPAVAITRQADFPVQNIRLVNDSRSPERRKAEIFKTVENLIKRSRAMKGMALSYGDGFLEPIDLNDEALQLLEERNRVDTSYVDIYAKVALDPDRSSKAQIGDLREFIAGVDKSGRTEILPQGDIGLTIIGPEQYRYEILGQIAEENVKVNEAMNGNCKISIGGLESRV